MIELMIIFIAVSFF